MTSLALTEQDRATSVSPPCPTRELLDQLYRDGRISQLEYEAAAARSDLEVQQCQCTCVGTIRALRLVCLVLVLVLVSACVAITTPTKTGFLCPNSPVYDCRDGDDAQCTEVLGFNYHGIEWSDSESVASVSWADVAPSSNITIFPESSANFTLGSPVFQELDRQLRAFRVCYCVVLTGCVVLTIGRVFQCWTLPCSPASEPQSLAQVVLQFILLGTEVGTLVVALCGIIFLTQTSICTDHNDNALIDYYPSSCELGMNDTPALGLAITGLVLAFFGFLLSVILMCCQQCNARAKVHTIHVQSAVPFNQAPMIAQPVVMPVPSGYVSTLDFPCSQEPPSYVEATPIESIPTSKHHS